MLQDVAVGAKLGMLAMTLTGIVLQFAGVYFLIPLALHLIVCMWLVVWWQID